MTQYNNVNIKLPASQLNTIKSARKNSTVVTLRLSSNMIGNSNDEINFAHKLLLTDRQIAGFPKVFASNSPANVKLSKTQMSKMIQLGRFFGRLLGPLMEDGLPVMKNVIKQIVF